MDQIATTAERPVAPHISSDVQVMIVPGPDGRIKPNGQTELFLKTQTQFGVFGDGGGKVLVKAADLPDRIGLPTLPSCDAT